MAFGVESVLRGRCSNQSHRRSVDHENLAADILRRRRRKESNESDDVFRREGIDFTVGQIGGIAENVCRHRGSRPGQMALARAVPPQSLGRRECQCRDAGLGRTIVGLTGGAGQPGLRRGVDEAAVDRTPLSFALLRQYAAALRVSRKCPRRCTAMTASQSSSLMLNNIRSRVMPALLTTMLSPQTVRAGHQLVGGGTQAYVTGDRDALAPAPAISSRTSDASSAAGMSLTTTVAPERASPMASAFAQAGRRAGHHRDVAGEVRLFA